MITSSQSLMMIEELLRAGPEQATLEHLLSLSESDVTPVVVARLLNSVLDE